jgi:hypothetical protein
VLQRASVLTLIALTSLSAAQAGQTFTGVITDSVCAKPGHSQMQMGSNDAECTTACISAHGATYVLNDGKQVYTLSDQQMPEKFAAQKVVVIGTLDTRTKTIKVQSIKPSK